MMQTILFLLGGVALVIIVVQMILLSHARKQRVRELYNLTGELGEAVRAGARAIVYFHSPSCSASRKQTPVVEKLAGEFENVFSLDIGEHCDVARAVGIHVTPTVVIIEGGEIRDVLAGARTEDLLREALL